MQGHKPRQARAYENKQNLDRCPVKIYEKYVSQCPRDALAKALYLQPKRGKLVNEIKFSVVPVGHNTLQNFVTPMMCEAGFQGNFTNHSLRVTTASRLYQAGVSEQLIMNKTGHRSSAVQGYKGPSTEQLQEVSSKIQCKDVSKPCSILKGTTDPTHDKVTPCIDSIKPSVVINIYGGSNIFNT